MPVLVTGGAGYIGSHMALALLARGEPVVILDNLSTGLRSLAPRSACFVEGDVGDADLVRRLVIEHRIHEVLHFAASTVVPESVAQPLAYYRNNTVASRMLLEVCAEAGVRRFVFSSTAAIYGEVSSRLVDEAASPAPINPYGRSKLVTEWMLQDVAVATPLRFAALRYFNVAGADPLGRSGQSTPRATHLIKRACQVALGRLPCLGVFGVDYPTSDGTAIRDYIHVSDLVGAHILALDHLRNGGAPLILNCGYGRGFSVRDVIAAVERVAGVKLPLREMPRRAGDSAEVVADSGRLRRELGWKPNYDDLDTIVRHALDWERTLDPETAAA